MYNNSSRIQSNNLPVLKLVLTQATSVHNPMEFAQRYLKSGTVVEAWQEANVIYYKRVK